jgi:hypothetical protein
MIQLVEKSLEIENPEESLAMRYAKMYGILSAYITPEQAETILRHRAIPLP